MISAEILAAIRPVTLVFEQLGVSYLIGGSVASSVYGVARSTLDADLMADLKPEQVSTFIALLEADYYISEPAIRDALARHSSFNLIHFETMVKVDIFIPKGQPFDQSTLKRKQSTQIDKTDTRPFQVASPEDIILLKLDWFKQGGSESERQWRDIAGVLRVQAKTIDREYLKEWAEKLGLADLLVRVFQDVGL
ncbi:MAG: nucleotidyltransferase [Chloroflexi bacterium]|nr:nucleotidyltransferase [Chloroflexota bacterium]OJW06487.1 MAG: hypothetical protein BGO39_00280 [Chloroflexi bacterium 54-19]